MQNVDNEKNDCQRKLKNLDQIHIIKIIDFGRKSFQKYLGSLNRYTKLFISLTWSFPSIPSIQACNSISIGVHTLRYEAKV